MSNDRVRASVITFSSWANLSIKFYDHDSTASFNAAVDAIPYMGFKTRIDAALQLAKSDMFIPESGARGGIPKILVLLTDGTQTLASDAVDPAIPAKQLRGAGVNLVVVGIGRDVDINEIKKIAGDKGKFHTAESFDKLISYEFINSVSLSACPGKPLGSSHITDVLLR